MKVGLGCVFLMLVFDVNLSKVVCEGDFFDTVFECMFLKVAFEWCFSKWFAILFLHVAFEG